MADTAARYKPAHRPRRPIRLPRLGWGWAVLALVAFAVAKTWPIWTALTVTLSAAALITRAIRPRRLNPLWQWMDRAAGRRRALPNGPVTLHTFLRMHHTQFEHAIAELAERHPTVHSATRVGGANDGGADVLVHLTDGRRILIQAKHHRPGHNVGSPVVQTVNGVYRDLHHCHAAAIVTTAGFTQAARDTNARLPYGIRLIDGAALTAWANGGPTPWQ